MENYTLPPLGEEQSFQPEAATVYPPKYVKQEQPSNVWLKSFVSLALYLVLGYYIFPSYKILLLITAIVMFHELGHFFAMKYFRYSDLGIFFIPLLGAYVSGTKREVSQKQSAIILLAGPLPGIIIGVIMYLWEQYSPGTELFGIALYKIAEITIILNLINLFPVYPLDGGQLLNRVFLDEESIWSKIFVFLSAGLMVWLAWKLSFYALLIFPVMMLLRLAGEKKYTVLEKRIENEGIPTEISYEELPDKDYWRIRDILIQEHSSFKDMRAGAPYEYDAKEEKVMTTIQSLLHRSLIQDVSIAGKFFIFIIWAAAFAAPWLIDMDMSFFRRFGIG